jgi:hypothetical protein
MARVVIVGSRRTFFTVVMYEEFKPGQKVQIEL